MLAKIAKRLNFGAAIVLRPEKLRLKKIATDQWPTMPEVSGKAITAGENFKTGISEALQCASTDESRYMLTGVALDGSERPAFIVGIDGYQLYRCPLEGFSVKALIVIPDSKFLKWPGFGADGQWRIVINAPSLVKITSPRWTYISKLIEGDYPNWRSVFSATKNRTTAIKLSSSAVASLQRELPGLPVDKENNSGVKLEVSSDGKFSIKCWENDGTKWTGINVAGTTVKGGPVAVTLRLEYVLKALRFGMNSIAVDVTGNLSLPVMFRGAEKTLLAMPLRELVARNKPGGNSK
jgi:DNA polymerase III sliding clamp (beta) subunit (PCNA family)